MLILGLVEDVLRFLACHRFPEQRPLRTRWPARHAEVEGERCTSEEESVIGEEGRRGAEAPRVAGEEVRAAAEVVTFASDSLDAGPVAVAVTEPRPLKGAWGERHGDEASPGARP